MTSNFKKMLKKHKGKVLTAELINHIWNIADSELLSLLDECQMVHNETSKTISPSYGTADKGNQDGDYAVREYNSLSATGYKNIDNAINPAAG